MEEKRKKVVGFTAGRRGGNTFSAQTNVVDHMREIARHSEQIYNPHVDEIQDQLKKYREMEDFVVKAPSRTK